MLMSAKEKNKAEERNGSVPRQGRIRLWFHICWLRNKTSGHTHAGGERVSCVFTSQWEDCGTQVHCWHFCGKARRPGWLEKNESREEKAHELKDVKRTGEVQVGPYGWLPAFWFLLTSETHLEQNGMKSWLAFKGDSCFCCVNHRRKRNTDESRENCPGAIVPNQLWESGSDRGRSR